MKLKGLYKIARGRHSEIYLTKSGTIIKKFKQNLLLNYYKECFFLKLLSDYDFVPKIIRCDDKNLEIEMEFINCPTIEEFLEKENNAIILINTLKKILEICYFLDKRGIQKEEMNRPLRHIFICKNRIVFIDWERAKLTKKPNNLLQFIEYLYSREDLLRKKEIYLRRKNEMIELFRDYKKHYSEKCFNKILKGLFKPPS